MGQPEQYDSAEGAGLPFLEKDGQEIYVSPQGDDAADGGRETPVQTLERAVALAEQQRGERVSVYMREGVYPVNNTINLSYAADWTAPLRISAYNGESVTLSAGADIPLSAMEPADEAFVSRVVEQPAAGSILQYDLKAAGITDYGAISRRGHLISEEAEAQAELSLNGTVQNLAGWPNDGFTGMIKPAESEYGKRTKAGIANGCSFVVDYDRPSMWNSINQAWLAGTLGPNYEFDYYPVSRFDSAENRVYLREGAIEKYYTEPYYRFENIPEELDSPGEYYIDRDSGMLYFYPPAGTPPDSTLTLTMPTPNQKSYDGKVPNDMFRLENCSNITFEGIRFTGGRGSAVTGKNNSHISFVNCEIDSFGANGIRLDFSTNVTVRNSRIHDVGQDGLQFSNCGDYTKLIPNFIMVCNNEIYRFARLERSYKAGLNLGYRCVGATAARNHIYDGPHTGLIFYGVNNKIYGNELHDLVTEFNDMDALYANNSNFPWERGNRIYGNYFHDIGRRSMNGKHQINVRAIRSDNKGCGLNVYQNIFYRIGDGGVQGRGNNGVGAITAEGTRNKIYNNLFVDCTETYSNGQAYRDIQPAEDGTMYPDTVTNSAGEEVANTINGAAVASLKTQMQSYLPVYGVQFPELYQFFYEHPNAAKTNEFYNNMIVNMAFPLSVYNGEPDAEGFRGTAELISAWGNDVITADPGFADYAGGNFALSAEAQQRVEGIPNFVMSAFGTIK